MPKPNKPHQKPAQPAPAKPPRPFAVQLAADPGPFVGRVDLQRILSGRLPEEWTALQSAAAELTKLDEEACDGPEDYDQHDRDAAAAEARALVAARAIFGPRATVFHQGDPRGLPLYVAWPRMPDRYRCPWSPCRGMPIYLPEREDRDE
jgi:hypothetical protein